MKIPKFWANVSGSQTSPEGKNLWFSCWRWSDSSQADAEQAAAAAAERIRQGICLGQTPERYPYGATPLREELLQTILDSDGRLLGAVTRNQYGSVVLNTQRVMFVDIDFPEELAEQEPPKGILGWLLGAANPSEKKSSDSEHEQKTRAVVEDFAAAHPDWNIRLYRTCAGLRGLVTHPLLDPASSQTHEILEALGADPLFIRLCKLQECFRARLTPKPWRCGHYANTIRYPIQEPAFLRRYQEWLRQYEERQRGYATCRWLGEVGSRQVHPEAELIIQLHDFVTRCQEPLPLA